MSKKKITTTSTFVDEDGNTHEYKEERTVRRYTWLVWILGVPFVVALCGIYPWFIAVIAVLVILGIVGHQAELKERRTHDNKSV